jgi:acetyl esterase/lipase
MNEIMKRSVARAFRALPSLAPSPARNMGLSPARNMGLAVAFFFFLSPAFFQAGAQDVTLKVWPGGVPGSISNPDYQMETIMVNGTSPRVSKVTDPILEVWLAPAETATGAAVVICPGGGYSRLAIDHEGYQVAAWLNDHGITGILLTYRLPSDAIMKDKSIGPLQDAQEAIRIARRHSGEWNINPDRIGIMGFSAGGHLASTASTHFSDVVCPPGDGFSARPDFSILIYPVISMDMEFSHRGSRENLLGKDPSVELIDRFSNEKQVKEDTPPAFLVHSVNDPAVSPENSIRYLLSLRKYEIPCELHLYQEGGHGYGLGQGQGTQSAWPDACIAWLKMNGFIE